MIRRFTILVQVSSGTKLVKSIVAREVIGLSLARGGVREVHERGAAERDGGASALGPQRRCEGADGLEGAVDQEEACWGGGDGGVVWFGSVWFGLVWFG